MIRCLAFVICSIFLLSCKEKKKNGTVPEEDFFPVTAFLKGEIARMDSSLATFYKIETAEGKSDTTAIKNTEVKQYAADFAGLPDISSENLKDDYQFTKEYDDILNAYAFIYTTKENHPVRREDVVLDIAPNEQGKNDVKSIFVEHWQDKGDSLVRKNMLWETGKNFQITTVTEAGGTQKTKKLQVVWNGFDSQNR